MSSISLFRTPFKRLLCALGVCLFGAHAQAAIPIEHWTHASGARVYLVATPALPQADFVLDLDGEDGRARVRGEKVGFVFQSFQLLPSLTALENVMLPLELRGDADVETPARAILEKVGLGARLDHYPRQLSGGEQQRVALARAFVTRPSLLFADEPTGNLDTQTGQAVIELLFALNAEAGTTLVLVTHDDHLASRCGRQLRLDAGRLVQG